MNLCRLSFGLTHDSGDCEKGYMMNAGQAHGPKAFQWSPCSNKQMKEIFGRYTCYNNKPPSKITLPVIPPGHKYDADKQCKLMYGDGYSLCPVTTGNCDLLFCYKHTGCSSSGAPPVDGTPCGHRKWCIGAHCVEIGSSIPPAINGDWGDWGAYTPCSRTCGGGVQHRTRECNNPRPQNHGKYCPGSSIGEWRICNDKDCPPGTPNYRKFQCLSKKLGRGLEYTDYYGGSSCSLLCRRSNVVKSEGSVADGTRYTDEPHHLDICISGKRVDVGCDNVIHSKSIIDRCMKCLGNGSTCIHVKAAYTKQWLAWGAASADPIIVIPAGSTQFYIKENSKTWNLLNMKLFPAKSNPLLFPERPTNSTRTAAGTVIRYNIHNSNLDFAESMAFLGPTTKALVAMYVYVGFQSNAGYKYSFYKPGKAPDTAFIWKTVLLGPCTTTCAGGVRAQRVTCHRQDDQSQVDGIHCNKSTRPKDVVPCNEQPCPGRWEAKLWGPCSSKCGGGSKIRLVPCIEQVTAKKYRETEESKCNISSRPHQKEVCNYVDCPPVWVLGEWSACVPFGSKFITTRRVGCQNKLSNGTTVSRNISICSELTNVVPESEKECTIPTGTIPTGTSSLQPTSRSSTTEIRTIIAVHARSTGDSTKPWMYGVITIVLVVAAVVIVLIVLYRFGKLKCRQQNEPKVDHGEVQALNVDVNTNVTKCVSQSVRPSMCLSYLSDARYVSESVSTLNTSIYFSVLTLFSPVPEYDVINLSSPQPRRSSTRDGKTYTMSAFGKQFLLDLTPASDTIGPEGVVVQRRMTDGFKEEIYHPDGEFYHGQVSADSNSKVAVRVSKDGKELSGSIFTNDHVYKIEPIKEHLKNKANLHGNGYHVVSRRKITRRNFEKVETSKVPNGVRRRTKRSTNSTLTEPRFIELMITIDKPTYDFYGNDTLDYVVNVANMVNRLYKDPSMGFTLSVPLTKVFIIEYDEPALDIKTHQIDSAVSYLGKFREWATKQASRTPPAAPGHFDNGALLTRYVNYHLHYLDIHFLGVAYAGYPCNPNLAFSINEAQGLQAAFSIAHEMAHNIGLGHDEGECFNRFIMSAGQQSGPNSFRWSTCSSKKMKEIMSREQCYSDKPAKAVVMPTSLPGYIFDADAQCKMAYGPSYSECSVTKGSCKQLFCMKGSSCIGKGAAPIDGTPCGQRKWCLRGHCVDIGNSLPPAIDGQWGSWSHYTQCTRSCGGGVRFKKRYCDNPRPKYGGKHCVGESEGHEEICNPSECRLSADLRKDQCIEKGVNDSYYRSEYPCTLFCRRGGTYKAYGSRVGCDNVLESGNEHDRCRKCGGNGGSCTVVKLPNYTNDYRVYGLDKPDLMFTIPIGAMNVKIQELGKTNNFMSLKLNPSSSTPYIFPVPRYSATYHAAGTEIEHHMKEITDNETIIVRGPTTKPLYAMFIYVGFYKNPYFSCQYHLPGQGTPTQYAWKVVKGTICDADCAGGVRINHVTCHRADDDTAAGTQYCNQVTKPATREPCNTQPCKPVWKAGDWMVCSKTCAGGQQTRSVTCVQKLSKSTSVTLNDSMCDPKSKPQSIQKCSERDCPPEWIKSPWSKCSAKCGGGSRSRTISCKETLLNQTNLAVDENSCITEVGFTPNVKEQCNTMDCYVWTKDYPCEGCKGYRHLGCYSDKRDRALPKLITSSLPAANAIKECYKAVKALGYDIFAVQNRDECWTSSTGRQTYNKHGSSGVCKDGKGGSWANDVYEIVVAPEKAFKPIGCFNDKHNPSKRPLPRMVSNLRDLIDWKNISKTVLECSEDAWMDGFPVFGLQYYGECWSGLVGHKSYSIDGVSVQGCWEGVGGSRANYVYAFTSEYSFIKYLVIGGNEAFIRPRAV
ncbi:hypothetical protein QZH41_017056, partial [Actinostola sp. cb2023]